jgi:uncharacterized protein YkwD
MSERGARAARRRSTRSTQSGSRVRRTVVSIGTVLLVITPISWILLHEPQSDQADASTYVTRDDDTYITASNEPVVDTSDTPSTTSTPTPGRKPTKPTRTPSSTPAPGQDPTTTPSDGPTTVPTDGPGDDTTTPTDKPTRSGDSHSTPTPVPSKPPTSKPPADDGSMSGNEQQLFSLIDDARVQNGCAPLGRESDLTYDARDEAGDRAGSGDVSSTGSSKASAGGEDMSAQAAFDRLKNESSGTLLNCGLHQLGVGRATGTYKTCGLLGLICSDHTRVAWVVDFQ